MKAKKDFNIPLEYVCIKSKPDIHTIYIQIYIYVRTHTYIHTYMDVSVAEWLAWLTSNCGRIGAICSSPSNGLKPNM